MILSSCGCKVLWALRGGAAPAGASLACVCYPHSKPGVSGILASASNPAAHGSGKSTGFSRTFHRKICGFVSMGTVVQHQSQLCAGNAINAENYSFMLRGFTIIFLHRLVCPPTDVPVLPAECIHVPPAVPTSEKSPPFFLKNFPGTSEKAPNA